jgi:hypothetical protein
VTYNVGSFLLGFLLACIDNSGAWWDNLGGTWDVLGCEVLVWSGCATCLSAWDDGLYNLFGMPILKICNVARWWFDK